MRTTQRPTPVLLSLVAAATLSVGLLASACDSPGGNTNGGTIGGGTDVDASGGDIAGGDTASTDTAASDTAGGDTAGSDTGAPSTLAPEDFPAAAAGWLCDRLQKCKVANNDNIFLASMLPQGEACVDTVLPIVTGPNALVDAIAAGTVVYDGAAGAACLAKIQGCIWALEVVEDPTTSVCADAFQGTITLGQPCHLTAECAGDAYCDTESACPGTCTARAALGQPCDGADETCAQESLQGAGVCHWDDGAQSGTCLEARRGADAAEGGACGLVSREGNVLTYVDCTEGLWCDSPSQNEPGTCRQPLVAGASCDNQDQVCVTGQACFPTPDWTGLSCQPIPIVNEVGGACGENMAYCNPLKFLTCDDTTKTCKLAGDGTEGSSCDLGEPGRDLICNEGLGCDTETHTCLPKRDAGEPCQNNSICKSGSCDWKNNVCAADHCE